MVDPTPKQSAFMIVPNKEVLYGGAAGGAKSWGLLAAASQYLDVPGYAALILRQTYKDLALPGALMDVSHQWWRNKGPKWKAKEYTWEFPEGSTLSFGYLESEKDKYQYQGSAFHFIGFDELTQFETETRYLYLFSRCRRPKGEMEAADIPLRVRSTTNPGGIGHTWVKDRFIEHPDAKRLFIPATLDDNPHLDQAEYEDSLSYLDPVTREQLRHGDWEIDPRGGMFKRHWFKILEELPTTGYTVRYWDLAASTEDEFRDPDWTVGTKMSLLADGSVIIWDLERFRGTPRQVEKRIRDTALSDGPEVDIFMLQDPGQAGKAQIDHYRREVLAGFHFRADKDFRTTKKEVRAKPFSSAAEQGDVKLLLGSWVSPWLDEHIIFPAGLPPMTASKVVDTQINFVYVTNKVDEATSWLRRSRFPFNVWLIAPDTDRVGLGALEIVGWQFFRCSGEEIQTAVGRDLHRYLDSRIRL
jgi:phage terminase large subunit-like protein